jgi:hypothetical protein
MCASHAYLTGLTSFAVVKRLGLRRNDDQEDIGEGIGRRFFRVC